VATDRVRANFNIIFHAYVHNSQAIPINSIIKMPMLCDLVNVILNSELGELAVHRSN
jgi:hypothetical protein